MSLVLLGTCVLHIEAQLGTWVGDTERSWGIYHVHYAAIVGDQGRSVSHDVIIWFIMFVQYAFMGVIFLGICELTCMVEWVLFRVFKDCMQ